MEKSSIALEMDCMDFLRAQKDKAFDLVLADPPFFSGPGTSGYYGQSRSQAGVRRVNYGTLEAWDVPKQEFYNEILRVSKEQIVWGINYYAWQGVKPGRIVWDKCNGSSSFSDCEIAMASQHSSTRMLRYMWNGHMQGKSLREGHIQQGNKRLNEKRIHPTQKPVALYQWLYSKYCQPGMLVLDTHLGSGSSRIAAWQAGLHFVGLDKSASVMAKQEQRWQEFRSQPSLFDGV